MRLYTSTNQGRSWTLVRPGHSGAQIPDEMNFTSAGVGFIASYDEVRRSIDSGRHWERFEGQLREKDLGTLPVAASGRVVYRLLFRQGVELVRSNDDGESWTTVHRWREDSEEAAEIEGLKETLASYASVARHITNEAMRRDKVKLTDALEEVVPGSDVRPGAYPEGAIETGAVYVIDSSDLRLSALTPSGHSVDLVIMPRSAAGSSEAAPFFLYIVDKWLNEVDGAVP